MFASGSSCVVDAVVECFRAPQRVGVVELEQVDAAAGVDVTAAVDLLVTVAPVDGDDLVRLRAGVSPAALLHVALAERPTWRARGAHAHTWCEPVIRGDGRARGWKKG